MPYFEEGYEGIFVNMIKKEFEKGYVKEVISFLKNHPFYFEGPHFKSILKVNGEYFHNPVRSCFYSGNNCLDLSFFKWLSPLNLRPKAVRNLLSAVEGPLTLGDKLIVRDIAIETFQSALEKGSQSTEYEDSTLGGCLQTQYNPVALRQLKEYGFQIKAQFIRNKYGKVNGFLDYNLNV